MPTWAFREIRRVYRNSAQFCILYLVILSETDSVTDAGITDKIQQDLKGTCLTLEEAQQTEEIRLASNCGP